ncbi:MAG TPA: STAS domain-containing protein [Solirubrobacteraceae bacterium]|nr:STAS domain-containing protein [Solirubrobacteraceae bacterium]
MLGDEHLQIDVRRERDRVVVGLRGELDLLAAPVLQAAVESPEIDDTEMLVIDLQDVRFVDSAGLRVILVAYERSQQRGQAFALSRGSAQVDRLLSIAGLDEHLRIIESPDELLV